MYIIICLQLIVNYKAVIDVTLIKIIDIIMQLCMVIYSHTDLDKDLQMTLDESLHYTDHYI